MSERTVEDYYREERERTERIERFKMFAEELGAGRDWSNNENCLLFKTWQDALDFQGFARERGVGVAIIDPPKPYPGEVFPNTLHKIRPPEDF